MTYMKHRPTNPNIEPEPRPSTIKGERATLAQSLARVLYCCIQADSDSSVAQLADFASQMDHLICTHPELRRLGQEFETAQSSQAVLLPNGPLLLPLIAADTIDPHQVLDRILTRLKSGPDDYMFWGAVHTHLSEELDMIADGNHAGKTKDSFDFVMASLQHIDRSTDAGRTMYYGILYELSTFALSMWNRLHDEHGNDGAAEERRLRRFKNEKELSRKWEEMIE
jgi:hypothetical protein